MISVRPGRITQTNRGTTDVGKQQTALPLPFPAPTEGLVTTASMASELPGAASVLENFLPTLTGVRMRGGSAKRGKVADGGAIRSAFNYKYGSAEKIFMATDSAIYNMSAPAVLPATTAAAVTGLHSGDFCAFQHTNAGVSYLVCVNGADTRQTFDGTTWGTTPAITFSDSTVSAQLSYGFLFKNREFYLKNASLDAYYLGLSAIGGAASVFPLGGVMKKGGSLLTGFSWSVETGEGPNDFCVFMSTEGEVAIYSGSDPGSATDFALRGVYQIGRPLGKNAWLRTGSDVLIATIDGPVHISEVFSRDQQTISLDSAARAIDDLWRLAASATGSGWTMTLWSEQNLVFVSFPENTVLPDTTFVMNAQNGKWGVVKNWHATCYQPFQGSIFYGSIDGYYWQGDISGADDGLPFMCTYLSRFTAAGQAAQSKTATMAHMLFRAKTKPSAKLFARADYDLSVPSYSVTTVGDAGSSEWDVGLWDVAKWDGVSPRKKFSIRQNVSAQGEMLAIGCVIVSSGSFKVDLEIDYASLQVESGVQSA